MSVFAGYPALAVIVRPSWYLVTTVIVRNMHKNPRPHQNWHCLEMRNLNSDLDYLLIPRCKHNQHDGCPNINMDCNPWLKTWEAAMKNTGGRRTSVTVQWVSVARMTLSTGKLNLISNLVVNSREMIGETPNKTEEFPVFCPLTYFETDTDSFSQ